MRLLNVLVPALGLLLSCSLGTPAPQPHTFPSFPAPAVKDMVFYELNFQTLSPPTLASAAARLDDIRSLGVNVLWLMPVQPKGQLKAVGSPYCVQDYTAVNPSLGTKDDLKTLIAGAHSRGMSVILDWVANHTAWDNPWITHKDWYTQDAQGNILSPAGFNWTDVADLNYANTDLRAAMIAAMESWVDLGVDGFRCDAADLVPDDFWTQAITAINTDTGTDRIFLAEGGQNSHYGAGFQLTYAWNFYDAQKAVWAGTQAVSTLFSTNTTEYGAIPTGMQKLRFTSNHDKAAWDGSAVTEFGGSQPAALSAFAAAAFLGGDPLIYSGQEVGWPNTISFFVADPIDWTVNPGTLAEYKRLMDLRSGLSAVRGGSLVSYAGTQVLAFERQSGSQRVLVLVNTQGSITAWPVPAALRGSTWTDTADSSTVTLGTSLSLGSYAYKILKL